MKVYDPEVAPHSREWLDLGEQRRIDLVAAYHRQSRTRAPNAKAHAVIHAIVENQIAEGLASVQGTMERLLNEGLSRHEALHAVGSVLAAHLHGLMAAPDIEVDQEAQARYDAELAKLTRAEWERQFGE